MPALAQSGRAISTNLVQAHPGKGFGKPLPEPDRCPPPTARPTSGRPARGGLGRARRRGRRASREARRHGSSPPTRCRSRPARGRPTSPPRAAAVLTSERTASAATAPSGWMAARLRTSAITKQPSTTAQVISPEVGEWPLAQDIAQMEHVIKRQELIEPDLAAVEVGHARQAILLDSANHRLAVVAGGQQCHLGQRFAERPALLGLEHGQGFRAGVGLGDRRDDRRAVTPAGSRESRDRWRTCRG